MKAILRCPIIASLGILYLFTGCQNDIPYSADDQAKNDYLVNWIKKFGPIDPAQDWNMATRITADIDPSTFGPDFVVNVYNIDPIMGGVLIAQVSTATTVNLDVAGDAESVFVRAYTPDFSEYMCTAFPIVNGKVDISVKSRASLPLSREDDATIATPETDRYMWILACEDLGSVDDYDFNDIVLGINYVAGDKNNNKLIITPLAAGGVLKAEVYYNETYLFEVHNQLNGQSEETETGHFKMHNTSSWDKPGTPYPINNVNNFSITDKMGGIKIKVIMSESSSVKDRIIEAPETGTAPQIICVNGDWEWPTERTKIEVAYPGFEDWSRNALTSSWTSAKAEGKVLKRSANYPFTTTHEAVDLGLKSGTKWATCNIGATGPSDNGYYFAWGETTTKSQYTYYAEGNSLWYGKDISALVNNDVVDKDDYNLMPHYDAATVIWGGNWRTPTDKEIEELITECTWTWKSDENDNGYYTIKSKSKTNSNTITLPASGYCISSSGLIYNSTNGYYWSATPVDDSNDTYAYGLAFSNSGVSESSILSTLPRYYSFPIRPVIKEPVIKE